MIKTILCALDGSEHSRKALDWAIDMASKHEARLVLLHTLLKHDVVELRHFAEVESIAQAVRPEIKRLESIEDMINLTEPYDLEPAPTQFLAEIGDYILKEAQASAREAGVDDVSTYLTTGDAARRICEYAQREGADCIVMGTRGLGAAKSLFLGSVSHKVCNEAPCTCITVH